MSVQSFDRYRASQWQEVYELGLCGHFRYFKVTLKLKLQTLPFKLNINF